MNVNETLTQLVMYSVEHNKLALLTLKQYGWSCEYAQHTDNFGIKKKYAIKGDDFAEAVIDPAWVIVGAL